MPILSYPAIARSIAQVALSSPSLSPLDCTRIAIDILFAPDSIRRGRTSIADQLSRSLEGTPPTISWVGAIYEHALASASKTRSHRGVFYTPSVVVEGLLDLTLAPIIAGAMEAADPAGALLSLRIIDPACGTGNFLFAAARRIARALGSVTRMPPQEALAAVLCCCICGQDIDRAAITIAQELAAAQGSTNRSAFAVRDSLKGFAATRQTGEKFDLVIGNPPFLNQLRTPTTRSRSEANAIGKRFPGLSLAYADTAFLFLLGGLGLCKPTGTLCMVQPISLLAARDAGPIRSHLRSVAALDAVWFATDPLFSAGVRVCAPILRPGHTGGKTRIFRGRAFEAIGSLRLSDDVTTWANLMSPAISRIALELSSARTTLGDIALVTADFRDEYYALKGCIAEEGRKKTKGSRPRIVTSGTIDLACNCWGSFSARIHKQKYLKPVADLGKIKGQAAAKNRLEQRLVPKVMLATQTRVIEVVIDDKGECLPVTPVITLMPREKIDLALIAAAAASPIACLWAVAHFGGTGMSIDAIKLSASQVREIPLPSDEIRWREAGEMFAAAQRADEQKRTPLLLTFASHIVFAYGLADEDAREALVWWSERMRP